MKRIIYYLLLLTFFISADALGQGSTTSTMRGTVTDVNGEALIGANVIAKHVPSGTVFGTATDLNGHYNLPGMRVGGPYEITVSYTGYSELKYSGVNLRLGESFRMDYEMTESAEMLDAIAVIATAGVSGQNAGSSTQISTERIENMPTLNRSVGDFLKLSPQSTSTGEGGTSFAGTNNRFNAIYIDGAVNNDVFGLAGSGTNGGQTGIAPFSIDIIDQFQIVLSPYDVTLGGFAGGGVNAVTKSGTNEFSGTAYYFFQNEKLAGKTNGTLATRLGIEDGDRTKLDEFSKKTYGASIGGPIKKDKIFFFTNVEIQDDEIPVPFETSIYTGVDGRASTADLDRLRNHLITQYNYDPGTYGNTSDKLEGLKLFGKLDFNLGTDHRLTLRHQYTKAEQFDRNAGSSTTLNFSNNGVFFPSTTNSSAIELNSRFGTKMSNNLILGYTKVVDDRDGFGDFPYLYIEDGNGTIRLGTEEFSTGNNLEQSTFTLTNNLKLYKGDHTITLGTHNEFYDTYNLFIRQNYGTYRFSSIDDFINGAPATEYDRSYSLVDNITGDGSAAAAEFNAMQLGFYVQDQWTVNTRFTLSAGLRLDVPIITTDPITDTYLNETALPEIRKQYPIANDVESGVAPDGQLMFSPRIGFEYELGNDRKSKLRGGVGIFTSRIPFVWPGGMYTNNGLTVGSINERDISGDIIFRPDINNQYQLEPTGDPSGQVDLFVKDFKYPQVLRGNLGFDKTFANGLAWTVEGLYTKTLNNILYTQVNSDSEVDFTWTGNGDDNRKVYTRTRIDDNYSQSVYVGSNTSEGYTYNLSTSLSKNFGNLAAYVAYSFGDAEAVSEGTSSQNSSQWRGQVSIDGRNNAVLGRSDFAAGHRVITSLTYKLPWTKDEGIATTFSLFYSGQAGNPFSYVIDGSGARNINNEDGSTSRNRSLVYVPQTQADINLIDYTDGDGNVITAASQWQKLDAFIEADNGLSNQRGGYAKKNGSWTPYQGVFDFAIRQDLGGSLGGGLHRIQLSLDIFNFANLLNKDWGVNYFNPGDFNNYPLYQFEGYAADGTTPQFTFRRDKNGKDDFDIAGTSSRWRMRVGVRYIFN